MGHFVSATLHRTSHRYLACPLSGVHTASCARRRSLAPYPYLAGRVSFPTRRSARVPALSSRLRPAERFVQHIRG